MKPHKVIVEDNKKLSIRISTSMKKEVLHLVELKRYINISDFVRQAIKNQIFMEKVNA